MSRDAEIAGFLARHGYAGVRAAPLAQDASIRRYLRLTGGKRPAVLMDAPPPEDVGPFVRIAAHFAEIGISAPEIFAADIAAGLVLEEDLGDSLYPVVMGEGEVCGDWLIASLFDAAIDVLVLMHRAAPPPDLPAWDAAAMRDTALATLLDWWWPAMFDRTASDAARADFTTALTDLLAPVATGPRGFAHRDYFAGNLLWLPERADVRRVGVIDFQGASIGHPAYDLVSLLQDARRVIPAPIAERCVTRYLAARPEIDAHAFRTAYAACAAQRHLRVVGQWVRLARRDNRPAYLAYGPHTWTLLHDALRHPAAAPLAAAMDRWIPPARRANPPDLPA
jgi:aminoglycoside/choline kinase family phosphotransferase